MMEAELKVLLSIRVSPELKRRVDRTAKKAGLSTSDWARAVLATAANQGAFAPKPKAKKGGRG